MYSDIYNLLCNLTVRFVKADIMSGVTNASKLMAVDLLKKENLKTLHSINIGFAALNACKNVSGVEVLKFRDDCCSYFQHLCTKSMTKCPLQYRLIKGATCLDPEVMLNDDLRKSRIDTALQIFIEKKRLVASNADIRREYVEVCNKKSVISKLTEFNPDRDRLDTVLNDILEKENAGIGLITFVQQIC